MPITINGSGSITGISAGGLPDDCITTADIAAGAVTDAKVNASAAIADSKLSGTTCKAWVNYNGSGASIRASYNVSSVAKNGTGDYVVNFSTAMPDANYRTGLACNRDGSGYQIQIGFRSGGTYSTSAVQIHTSSDNNNNFVDASQVHVAIFR